jgi:hypothetical protein
LNYAELNNAKLNNAKLNYAELNYAELNYAELNNAKLNNAELIGANIDHASFALSCNILKIKTDERQRIQWMFHGLSWFANADNLTNEEKEIYKVCLNYVNKFHRKEVERLKPLE